MKSVEQSGTDRVEARQTNKDTTTDLNTLSIIGGAANSLRPEAMAVSQAHDSLPDLQVLGSDQPQAAFPMGGCGGYGWQPGYWGREPNSPDKGKAEATLDDDLFVQLGKDGNAQRFTAEKQIQDAIMDGDVNKLLKVLQKDKDDPHLKDYIADINKNLKGKVGELLSVDGSHVKIARPLIGNVYSPGDAEVIDFSLADGKVSSYFQGSDGKGGVYRDGVRNDPDGIKNQLSVVDDDLERALAGYHEEWIPGRKVCRVFYP